MRDEGGVAVWGEGEVGCGHHEGRGSVAWAALEMVSEQIEDGRRAKRMVFQGK